MVYLLYTSILIFQVGVCDGWCRCVTGLVIPLTTLRKTGYPNFQKFREVKSLVLECTFDLHRRSIKGLSLAVIKLFTALD